MFNVNFRATVWQYPGPSGWYFVTLPADLSHQMRSTQATHEGWGRLKVSARLGQTAWTTSAWYDAKTNCYQLPLKASVRQAEHFQANDEVEITVSF